jgi:thiamine kinase-like enzyme
MDIIQICKDFCIKGEFSGYEVIGTGNINATYKVHTEDDIGKHQYLIQKINKNVFKRPEHIMENIAKINEYIDTSSVDSELIILHFIKSHDGKLYHIDEEGNFWRACKFFDCECFNTTDNLSVVEETGRAFGEFQYLLSGFDASLLHITIPNFHNTKKRIENLEKTIKYALVDRKIEAKDDIEYILSNKEIALTLCKLYAENKLPLRVTHNDTKCNNVIFHKDTLKALAVIDLDTIMPGLCAYDFGDGARSICSVTDEDEIDLTKVSFDLKRFERFTKGYFKFLKNTVNEYERDTFALSVYVMTIELASRFLQDYEFEIIHVVGHGKVISQKEIEQRLINEYFPKRNHFSLFPEDNLSDEECLLSAYRKRNKDMGFEIEGE